MPAPSLSVIKIYLIVSPIRSWLPSLSVSLIIWIENGWHETFLTRAKDFDQLGECNQDFLAPALSHMPIEVVSVQREESTSIKWENATRICVLDRTGREREWMKKFEEGRKPTKGRSETKLNQVELWNCAAVKLTMRDRDEEMSRQNGKECDQIFRTEARILSIFWEKNHLSLEFWGRDCHFFGNSSILKPAINKNSQRLNRNRREIGSCWKTPKRKTSKRKMSNSPNDVR